MCSQAVLRQSGSADLGPWQQGRPENQGHLLQRTSVEGVNIPASLATLRDFPLGAESFKQAPVEDQEEGRILECAVRMLVSVIPSQDYHNSCNFSIKWNEHEIGGVVLVDTEGEREILLDDASTWCDLINMVTTSYMTPQITISCWRHLCFAAVGASDFE